MHSISAAAITNITEFDPQELSNTAWAVSRFSWQNPPLLDALSASSILTIHEFSSQNLNNPAWSLAVLGVCDRPLMEAIASSSLPKIREFNMQGLANTAWAYDGLGFDDAVDRLLQGATGVAPGAVDLQGGCLSWTDYGGLVSTRCGRGLAAGVEAVVRRDVLAPLLAALAAVMLRAGPSGPRVGLGPDRLPQRFFDSLHRPLGSLSGGHHPAGCRCACGALPAWVTGQNWQASF